MTQNMMTNDSISEKNGLLDRPLSSFMQFNWENIAWIALIIIAAVARFYDVGTRAMSHDESLHTLYSYYLYNGGNYEHNPMMHGPFLFHANALAYFLFGHSDTTARIVPVLSGLGVIWMARLFRPYIGRTGALVAGLLLTISPSLLFHSRYIRNDIYIALFTMIWIYGAFRYLDTRRVRWLLVMVLGMAFGFISKENHFITGAIIGLFFSMLALYQTMSIRIGWFLVTIIGVVVITLSFVGPRESVKAFVSGPDEISISEDLVGAEEGNSEVAAAKDDEEEKEDSYAGMAIGLFFATFGLWQIFQAGQLHFKHRAGERNLRQNANATLAVIMLTLILPFAAPIGHIFMEWDPLAYTELIDIQRSAGLVGLMTAISILIGFFWFGLLRPATSGKAGKKDTKAIEDVIERPGKPTFSIWLCLMGIFWTIQVLFFTTFLTNTKNGLATGIVGSLGYWLGQQEVARGGQPWYYYFMLSSLYEFLPMILSIIGIIAIVYLWIRRPNWDPVSAKDLPPGMAEENQSSRTTRVYFALFGMFWVGFSWLGYMEAGERMPWLLTHMALPMCVFGGWYLGRLLNRIDWQKSLRTNAVWLIGLAPALLFTLGIVIWSFPSFGREVDVLPQMTQWIVAMLITAGLIYLLWRWVGASGWKSAVRLLSVGLVAVLFLLTIRFSFMLTYINYDLVTEYLVYAHGAPGIKRALNEIDLISERTVGGRNIAVAYDDDSSWPLSWYMRLYPNSKFYGNAPNSDSMSSDVIIVGPKNYDKVRPYVQRDYVKRTYQLVWWPEQSYYNMSSERFWNIITDPSKLQQIADVFFYRRHQDENGNERTLSQWPNRHDFEMYVHRDIASEIWDLGVVPISASPNAEILEVFEKEIEWSAANVYSGFYENAALLTPRSVAIAPDGSRVIADSGNHRIVMVGADGTYQKTFGSLCRLGEGEAGGCVDPDGDGPLQLGDGQFSEPWGVAVGPDGNIYVSDTWNGRVQVFDSAGNFLRKWGSFGSTEGTLADAYILFGPRGIAIDNDGNLLVADTGNKRIIRFTPDGQVLAQIGGGGVILGHFEEPVSVAVNPTDGSVFVADAWNRRIQKFSPSLEALEEWPVPGWESQEIYHKPYIAVSSSGDVYVTDPQFYRVFAYSATGELKTTFGNYGTDLNRFGMPNGIAVDQNNNVVVADADNNRVLSFPPLP